MIEQVCGLDAKLIFHPYTSSTTNNLADVGLLRSPIIRQKYILQIQQAR